MRKLLSLSLGLLLMGQCLCERSVRAAPEAEKDMSTSETRIDPYLYGAGPRFLPVEGPIAPVVEPVGIYGGHVGPVPLEYGAGIGGYGGYGYGGIVGKPFIGGPFIGGGGGGVYNGGLYKSGINEGALALGNKGEQIYKQAIDGGFKDGVYHQGGGFKQGGYKGFEGYNDNKHRLADDHANKLYYSGVKGGKSDLGNGQIYDKNQGYALNSYNALGDNQLKGYQKGHKKTGFHKSYHKDESGNDESYYDSDHDEGKYEFGKKYGDKYDTNFLSGMAGGKKFNEYAAGEEGNQGYVGNGKLIAQNQGFKDYYGNNGYYNNANQYGNHGGGQSSVLGKFGVNHGFQNGFNNGKNFAGYQGAKFGGGFYGPYGY